MIATAILGSVVLLFKYAVPPQPPIKRYCERCTKSSLLARMRLIGQRYSSVTNGFGIKYREIKLKRLIVSIAQRAAECGEGSVFAWESEIISTHSLIEGCFEQGIAAARLAHSLGHVNGYPRIYLLCGELVSALCGNTDNSLVKCAVNEFERYAPLTAAEKDLFCGMLEFCLCELLYNYASAASIRNDAYLLGREDGAKGNVDLDRIDNADYVCGVTDCATSADGAAIERILECNGVDAESARKKRVVGQSRMFAVTESVIRSLYALRDRRISEVDRPENKISKRAVTAFMIAPAVLILLTAVLTAVFVPARLVAVFAVCAVIIYGAFRLPLLLYAPDAFGIDIWELIKRKKRARAPFLPQQRVQTLSETAYFGGEPIPVSNTLTGRGVKISCDNFGAVSIAALRYGNAECAVHIECRSLNDAPITLESCDGAASAHKATYCAMTERLQFSAEFLAAPDCDCGVARISVINRTPLVAHVNISCRGVLTRGACECGMALYALDICDCARFYGVTSQEVFADLTLAPFAAERSVLCVCFGEAQRALARIAEYVGADGYFSAAEDYASAYFGSNRAIAPQGKERVSIINKVALPAPAEYPSGELCPIESGVPIRGDTALLSDELIQSGGKGIENIMSDGAFTLACSTGGVRCDVGEETLCKCVAVMGENGVLWSPLGDPFRNGELRIKHGLGYSEYSCSYNGIIATVRCALVYGKNALIFDVRAKNRAERERSADMMFSVIGGKSVKIFSSAHITDSTAYKEGYVAYGKIDRVRGFGKEGISAAPTVSVSLPLGVRGSARAVFCVGGDEAQEYADVEFAESIANENAKRIAMYMRILPRTRDKIFDKAYVRALYNAHNAFMCYDGTNVRTICILSAAAKYVDPDAVKERIARLFAKQDKSGAFDGNAASGIYAALAVADIAEFTCDKSFWNRCVPYSADGDGACEVTDIVEHCMRGVDAALPRDYPQNTHYAYLRAKSVVALLHRFTCRSKKGSARRKLYIAELSRAASICAKLSPRISDTEEYCADGEGALIRALALYVAGDGETAYGIISDHAVNECTCGDPICSALFYMIATERFLGIRKFGSKMRIAPDLPESMQEIDVYLTADSGTIRVNAQNDGADAWHIRSGRIEYSTSVIDLSTAKSGEVLLLRDGSNMRG